MLDNLGNKIIKIYQSKNQLILLFSLVLTYILYLPISQYSVYFGVYLAVIFSTILIWEFKKYQYRMLLRIFYLIFIVPPFGLVTVSQYWGSFLAKLYLVITIVINLLYILITSIDLFNYISNTNHISKIKDTSSIINLKTVKLLNKIKLIILEYKMLIPVLFIMIFTTTPVFFLGTDSPRQDNMEVNVSYYQYSESNTTSVVVIPESINNSDYLIVKKQRQPTKTETICKNKKRSDQIYIPNQSNKTGPVNDNINSRYASIIDPRCEFSMSVVKNLNSSDVVHVFGSQLGNEELVSSYKVK